MELSYEDQNVNTINIPRQTKQNKINLYENNPILDNKVYKLEIHQKESELLTKEFEELIKEIIEKDMTQFLTGDMNLIEYLISKHSMSKLSDINSLESITLKTRENFGMLNEFGLSLPNLKKLNLSMSQIRSVEEIGTHFNNLVYLNISHCNLVDLSGIFCFRKLKFLDCSFNNVFDLLELEMCQNLEKINLKNNYIEDEDNFTFLQNLNNLNYINLNNNPVQTKKNYREIIEKFLPHVKDVDKDLEDDFDINNNISDFCIN